MREDEVNLLNFFRAALQRWPVVMAWAVALAALVGAYTLLVPARWAAHASLLLPIPDTGSASDIPRLQVFASGPQPTSMLRAVIESRQAIDEIATATALKPRQVRKMLFVEEDLQRNLLSISSESTDRDQALKVVTAAVGALTRIERDVGFSIARKQVRILETTVGTKRQELVDAEQKLLAYQKSMKTVPDDENGFSVATYARRLQQLDLELGEVRRALEVRRRLANDRLPQPELPTGVEQLDRWRERLREAEFQLALERTKYKSDAPSVRQLQRGVDAAREALQREVEGYVRSVQQTVNEETSKLEARRLVLEFQVETARRLAERAPGEAVEFGRLLREVNSASETLKRVQLEYEVARTQAEASRVRWTLLDPPYLEDEPVNKGFARNLAFAVLLGLVVGLFAAASRPR